MIKIEVLWRSGTGSRPVWEGELPAVPRAGDQFTCPGTSGKVEHVHWVVTGEQPLTARVTVGPLW